MGFLRKSTPEDADLAAFADAVRSTLVVEPDRASSEALVRTLAETARAAAVTAPTTQRREAPQRTHGRWGRFARVALVTASIPLLFAGLAFAGVRLPVVDSAFESIGIELPNQAADDDTEGTAKDGDSAGSATGQENSRGKLGHGKSKAKQGKGQAKANGKALGKQGLAPGQTKETGKPDTVGAGSSNAGGNASGSPGKGTSGSSSGGSSNAGGSGGGPTK